jgi:hypothetical protein
MINQEKNKIELVSTEAKSENSVLAKYKLSGSEFSVEWNNIHPGTGEILDQFGLCDGHGSVISDDVDLKIFIEEEISKGEDSDIYLSLRDTFDASDARDLALELGKPKAVARDIEDFDFEAGWPSGYGDYVADINIDGKEFSVDLIYEYGYYDVGEFVGCDERNGSDLRNDTAIKIAAQQAGIELDDNTVLKIKRDLESQVEVYVEDNYYHTIENLLMDFESFQEKLRREHDDTVQRGNGPGM